ncbi:MAG: hypothetical protein HYR73_02300, partial [Candidatus Eisenbacteria bacterium]|nr:hypothetical protein [Candidatus Eisenbacteria bacterium]
PDLAVVATALEQPTLYAGETVAIQSVLFNAGRPPVSNVPVELRADGATVDVQPVSFAGLMPEVVTFHWTPAADGPHELSVVIDPFGQVDEASSAQDSAGGPVTILSNTENNIQIDSLWVGFETGPPPVAVRRVPGAAGGSVRSPSAQLDLPAGFSYRTVTFGLGEIVPESTGIAPASGDSYTGPIVNLTPHVLEMLRPATLTVRVNWPGDPGLLQPFRFEDSTATWVPVMLGGGPVAGGWAFVIDRTGMYSVQGGGGVTETEQVEVVSADADSRQARVTWFVPATLRGEEAVVCRHAPGGAWIALASVVPDGTGRVVYVDTDVRPGQRITYGLRLPSGDPARIVGEVTLEIPQADAFKLDGPRSNPSVGPLIVSFSLPSEAAATLELLDPAGRRVRALALTALGPGNHWLNLSEGGRLASGFYLLRLKQGDRSLTRRVAVLQ